MVFVHLMLIVLLGLAQWALWHGDGGFRTLTALQEATRTQVEENARLTERNLALAAEVADLKQGLQAVEELARSELGFIRKGETFFHVIGTGPAGSSGSE